ncbi:Nif3-like dinuclear metal center hexameric protein [Pusillimonas sp.]|uniref:Nif3-like dinuclear metal center hexameric protein n=1 Tax=Pusillimonas sp. TaxID=3040095 RepID=UPI0037C8C06B
MKQINTRDLATWLDDTLQPQHFRDYCPNGLQVEGKPAIGHIITGVTASRALLEEAIRRKADAVFVHHGWFWKNEDARIIGAKRERIALALQHELNVFAYHLPLDAHPQLGNNAQLARVLGFTPDQDAEGNPRTCGPENLIWLGRCQPGLTLEQLGRHVAGALGREPLVLGRPDQTIERVAWCTGGAQGWMQEAIDAGAQAYVTGEASEPNFHLANETGVGFIGAGHHATERYGAQAVGQAIEEHFGIKVEFIDLDNPV